LIGVKWVKTEINQSFSVEIEPKKNRIKIEELRAGCKIEKNLKFE
jgi:hypothetical protein